MAGCGCEWPGDCACEVLVLQVLTPAKSCKVALKNYGRDASPKSVTASEPTND